MSAPETAGVPAAAEAPGARRSRLVLALLVVLALALHLPTAGMGFYADDWIHQLALDRPELDLPLAPWALYDFGSAADWRALAEHGWSLPWWIDEAWTVRFFRPLASLSLALDHALWGDRAAGYHATSLALLALLLVAAHALYRALGLSRGTALLAVGLVALSDTTVLPVGWIANRNTLLATLFTVLAALVLERRARAGDLTGRAVAAALGLAALACLCKESGVAAPALVALRLALLRRASADPATRRLAGRGALAAVLLAAAFVVGVAAAGYGTRSLFYATPWRDPLQYAARLGVLATAGVLSLVGPVPVDLAAFVPGVAGPLVLVSLALLVPLALWTARALRGRTAAGFLAGWIALTVLPEGGAPPSVRLLFPAMIGAAGLVALLVSVERARPGRGCLVRVATWVLIAAATAGSGLFLLTSELTMRALADQMRTIVRETDLGTPADGPRDAFVLQSDAGFTAFALAATWGGETGDETLAIHALQLGRRGLRWTRVDARTFELESLDEPFLETVFERLYRVSERAPAPGTVWRGPRFAVEALDRDAAGLRRIRVRLLDGSLDDETVYFLVAGGPGVVPTDPPAVGETVEVPTFVSAQPWLP